MGSKAFGSFVPARPHLIAGPGGQANEIELLRSQIDQAFTKVEDGVVTKHFSRVQTPVVDRDGIKQAFASQVAPAVLVAADFDGILAPGTENATINTPKRPTIFVNSTGTPANFLGGNVTFKGTDVDGKALSETVVAPAGQGTTTCTQYFATVTEVDLPAAAGTGASLELGVAADTACIASLVSSASAQSLGTNAVFNRTRVGNRVLKHARRLSFVFNNDASWLAGNLTIVYLDARNVRRTGTIAIPSGGNATVNTSFFVKQVVSLAFSEQGGTTGTCDVGILNTELGLDIDALSDVEAVCVIREASAPSSGIWAVPTAGAVDPSTVSNAGPLGRYIPDSSVVPDGIRSYVLVYLSAHTTV